MAKPARNRQPAESFEAAVPLPADRDISARKRQRRSIVRAFEILQAFRYPGEWVRGSDLSRRTMIPEATVYGLMTTLEGVGAVIRDGQGQYQSTLLSVARFNKAIFAGSGSAALDPAE
jgi:hypothetical protein